MVEMLLRSPRLPSTTGPSSVQLRGRCRRPAITSRATIVQNATEAEAEARAAALAPITKRVLDDLDSQRSANTSAAAESKPPSQQRQQAGGAGGATTWDALLRADSAWARVKEAASGRGSPAPPPPEFISLRLSETAAAVAASVSSSSSSSASSSSSSQPPSPLETFDVAVAGGTLGVILAAALSSAGLRVAVVEAGPLKGREQEWNICREELDALVRAGAISASDASDAVVAEFNPVRCAFGKRAGETPAVSVITTDVLNLVSCILG